MHQPYYKNLLNNEASVPWVRLHGLKDYLDMVKVLQKYPNIHQTFNLVPSLIEQIEDYTNRTVKDRYLELSCKAAADLNAEDKKFILDNFFKINKDKVISFHPRYYELYFKKESNKEFNTQDFLDLQVWFNLAWTDPYFRQNIPELKNALNKARFFTEEDKHAVLDKQLEILEDIIPGYKEAALSGQIEVTITPFYHPILPLLYNTKTAREANLKSILPHTNFAYPQDAKAQVDSAVEFFKERFGFMPQGMWPSEESVSEHILPFIIQSGINWIVADEAILFKSGNFKKRDTKALYQPYKLKRKDGELNIIFRDRNLSDLIGFVYHDWNPEDAAEDFIKHLENTYKAFKDQDILLTIAMDGENAWEYFINDGHNFLNALYKRLSDSKFIKSVTVSEYLKAHPAKNNIKHLACGSWIYGNFNKWMGNPYKAKAWEWLALARKDFQDNISSLDDEKKQLAYKQLYIAEGSDWFWWYGEDPEGDFDRLFRMHLSNLYTILNRPIPGYLNNPLSI